MEYFNDKAHKKKAQNIMASAGLKIL